MPEDWKYPILVKDYDPQVAPADLAVCVECEATFHVDPADGDPYDRCLRHKCGGQIVMKFDAVGACANCDEVGLTDVGGCCSRRCRLQLDYAEKLARDR